MQVFLLFLLGDMSQAVTSSPFTVERKREGEGPDAG